MVDRTIIGDAGHVLDHTLQEGKDRALYFGRFIKHSEIHHQSAQHGQKFCHEIIKYIIIIDTRLLVLLFSFSSTDSFFTF